MDKVEKKHGDAPRIAQIAANIATLRGLKPYAYSTVRLQLNGTRTLMPIVKEAAEKYYQLISEQQL